MVDRNGNTTTLSYTGNRLTSITDPVGRAITLSYDPFTGFVTQATDPLGRVWRYSYQSNSLVSVTDPLGNVVRYEYSGGLTLLSAIIDPRGNPVKRISYDINNRVIAEQFADGGVERYAYTLSGTIVTGVTVTDPLGRVTSKRFAASGYVIETTDAFGQIAKTTRDLNTNLPTGNTGPCGCSEGTRQFDERGNPLSGTNRIGQTIRMEYEPVFNKVTKVINEFGQVTTFAYDARGNLISTTNPLNETTTITYDQFGLVTSITDGLGHTTRMEYDAQGNLIAEIDALNNRTAYEYDAVGRRTAVVDPLGRRSSVTYDELDRVVTNTDSAGAVTHYDYDPNGNVIRLTDALARQWTAEYDVKDRLVSATDPLSRVTRFEYNLGDEIVKGVTPSSRVIRYEYDARGQRTAAIDPLGQFVRFSCDNRGKLTTVTDQRGNITTFQYDELFRLIGSRDPLGRPASVSYDAYGNVASTVDRLGRQMSYEYDVLQRPQRISYADATVTMSYDAAGRVTRIDDTQSGFVAWSYDEANRLRSETTPQGAVSYSYNAASQRTAMTAADRAPVTYGYDTAGRLQTIAQGGETFTYGYDTLSRRVSLQRPNGVRTSYGWDQGDRLSRLTHTNAASVVLEDYQYRYTLDDEIAAITSLASATVLPAARTASAADAANRLSQFGNASCSFDPEGQTTAKTDGQGTTRYSWDARGRLAGVTLPNGQVVSYGYDAVSRRASRTANGVTTSFLYDGSDVVVDQVSGGSAVDYLHGAGIDEHLRQGQAGSGFYFLQDHLGSTGALTDASGGLLDRAVYEPFGGSGGSALTRYGYTGRERDALTGLLHYRLREYDAEQGRFLTEDPAGLSAGLNRYAYVANNPLGFNDPFGLSMGTFLSGLKDGVIAGAASTLVAIGVLAGLSALGVATGGTVIAAASAILTAYGLYTLKEEMSGLFRNEPWLTL
jgi:RHS repeat-associated protein